MDIAPPPKGQDAVLKGTEDRSLGRAEALRQTRVQIIDQDTQKNRSGADLFSYAHPIFWAPFTIVGDGGGAKAGS
jgi:CHAT domain-containing protein